MQQKSRIPVRNWPCRALHRRNARISFGRVDADAFLIRQQCEFASAGLMADEIVGGFGDGLGLWDCGGINGWNCEEVDGEEVYFLVLVKFL